MKAQDLIGKTASELQDSLMNLRKEQFTMRMQFKAGQLTNPSLLSKMRRDIARIKTAQTKLNASTKNASGAKAVKEK